MPINQEEKQKLVKRVRRKDADTGSPEVQIAILTGRIESLTGHLQKHVKDHHSRRGLLKLVGQRKRLVHYLRINNKDRYQKMLAETGIRK